MLPFRNYWKYSDIPESNTVAFADLSTRGGSFFRLFYLLWCFHSSGGSGGEVAPLGHSFEARIYAEQCTHIETRYFMFNLMWLTNLHRARFTGEQEQNILCILVVHLRDNAILWGLKTNFWKPVSRCKFLKIILLSSLYKLKNKTKKILHLAHYCHLNVKCL